MPTARLPTTSGVSDLFGGLTPPEPRRYLRRAWVRSVYDGDTLRVDIDLGFGLLWRGENGQGVALRLYGIDTPEMRGPDRDAALRARDAVQQRCPAGTELVIETLRDTTEKFGRLLVLLWLPGADRSLNEDLLEQGLGKPYDPR